MVFGGSTIDTKMLETWQRFLDRGWIVPVYQPIVELATGRIIGYEVLSRAYDADGTLIYLDDLFCAAQLTDQMELLDERLFQACFDGIVAQGTREMRFFINVLPQTLRSPVIAQALSKRDRATVPVVLEVNERTADPAAVGWDDLLDPLRKLGAEVAIDDVGSGYAGLNRTVEMAPHWIKMDIGLVRGIDTNPLKAAMVASIVTFAKRLGHLRVIAEGIETRAEYETLVEMGVDFGQGFGFARPHPQLLALPTVSVPGISERKVRPVDFARYGVVLADYLQRASDGFSFVADIALYVNRIMDMDHIAVFAVDALGQPLAETALPSLPASLRASLSAGHEVVTQQVAGLERPYSQAHGCQSAVIVPISARGQWLGVLYGGFKEPFQVRSEVVSVLRGFASVLAFAWTHRTEQAEQAADEVL